MIDRHTYVLLFDGEFPHPQIKVECPYPQDDAARPCWPHHETGNEDSPWEPDSPPQTMCTYQDWIECSDLEDIMHGKAEFAIRAEARWIGSHFEIHLLEQPILEEVGTFITVQGRAGRQLDFLPIEPVDRKFWKAVRVLEPEPKPEPDADHMDLGKAMRDSLEPRR